ncbi:MAG: hypothetical protein LBU73_06990, partial [Helicobacteraceae bacterium]|nr:hypothetical protein [Helicobacteraceae bacterium]
MKKLSLFALAITLIALIAAPQIRAENAYQLPLKKGVWHLIGVNGFHRYSLKTNFDKTSAQGYVTTFTYGGASGKDADGSLTINAENNLAYAQINYEKLDKNSAKAMLTMFIASRGEGYASDVEVRFQENYAGKEFELMFGGASGASPIYRGIFSPKYTRASPAVLELAVASGNGAAAIRDIVDMNLDDNNVSLLDYFNLAAESLNATGNSGKVTGGRQKMVQSNGERITIYEYDHANILWKIFQSDRPDIGDSKNDFTELKKGVAYWVRIDHNRASEAGLILGRSEIKAADYPALVSQKNNWLQNRKAGDWNMLSFNDGYLRHTPSAVFVPVAEFANGVILRDNFMRDSILIRPATYTAQAAAKEINRQAQYWNSVGRANWKIRAYPAQNPASGVVIISDEDFLIATQNTISSIAGNQLLIPLDANFSGSRADEHLLAFELNSYLFGNTPPIQKNGAIQVGFTGESAFFTIDLSAAADYDAARAAIKNSFDAVNDGVKRSVTLIDADFNGAYETLLIAASKRFHARDATFARVFDYENGGAIGEFVVEAATERKINYQSTYAATIAAINAESGITGAIAYDINGSRFALSAIGARNLKIREEFGKTRFFGADTFAESSGAARGAIGAVYSPIALACAVADDFGALEKPREMSRDLLYAAQFSPDFPIDGPLYSLRNASGSATSPEIIIGGATRDDDTILWRQADLTVPVDSQKTAYTRYNLFKTQKERGYWVYMSEYRDPSAIGETHALTHNVTRRYSNNFAGSASGEIAITRNEIDLDFTARITGFANLTQNPAQMPENVSLTIGDQTFGLIKNGTINEYFSEFSSRDIYELRERNASEEIAAITLSAANGLGDRIVDKIIYFDARKTNAPSYVFDGGSTGGVRGGISINPEGAARVLIYDGNLSDLDVNTNKIFDRAVNGVFSWDILAENQIIFPSPAQPFYDLRVIGEGANKLHSNSRRILYAPLYKGSHVISANAIKDGTAGNSNPIAFSADGKTAQNYGGDSGVALLLAAGEYNGVESNTTAIAYKPLADTIALCGSVGNT